VLELLTDPGFLRFIGDRGVRTLDDARRYIDERFLASYALNGFGLYAALRKEDGAVVGMCGLVKRDGLEDVDVGFALLPGHRGRGYAIEGASAVLDLARNAFGLNRIVAIVNPDNADSIRVLERLGMTYERKLRLHEGAPELSVYGISLIG
jgi:RimJ/RimL family protein N-acetyltransferase